MINIPKAISELYPQVIIIRNGVAYDVNNNEVNYDIDAVTVKANQNESNRIAEEQEQVTAKASALAKLTALGLTQDEVKALVG